MKVTKTHEESGSLSGDATFSYVNDFDLYDEYTYYSIQSGLCRMRFGKNVEKKLLLKSESLTNIYGCLSIDRVRRLLVSANCHGGLVIFRIKEDYDLEPYGNIIQLYETPNSDNAVSAIHICGERHSLLIGIGWSKIEKQQGRVLIVRNYSSESFEVEKLAKQAEGVKSVKFLRSNDKCFIFGGGTFYGNDHEWKLYDLDERKVHLVSDKFHKRPIRDISTFFNSEGEELVVTCSSDKHIGIWKLSGQLIHSHDFKEMHSGLLLVNNRKMIVSSNWGSLFTIDLVTYETNHVVPKDSRGSTTHVGRCVWIKRSKKFIATHGDGTIRQYKLEGEEREFFEREFSVDSDLEERVGFITSLETMDTSGIKSFGISLIDTSFDLPILFSYL